MEKAINLYKTTVHAQTAVVVNTTHQDFEIVAGELRKYRGASVHVSIPDGIVKIGQAAFSNCTQLLSVILPNSLHSIGPHAFYGCSALKEISIPNGVTSIGLRAFNHCTNLAYASIPDSATQWDFIFDYQVNERSFTISSNRLSSKFGVFSGCISLNKIHISSYLFNILNTIKINLVPNPNIVSFIPPTTSVIIHFWETPYLTELIGIKEVWRLSGLCNDGTTHKLNVFGKCKKCGGKF